MEVFHFQARQNGLYSSFLNTLKVDPASIRSLHEIPFLPISFFKSHTIQSGNWSAREIFTSSGTTGASVSKHMVEDVDFYHRHSRACFEQAFGPLHNYHILALLPSYLERTGSSLISMITHFIEETKSDESGFFLREYDLLLQKVQHLRNSGRRTIIWGVSFALLELAESCAEDLSDCLIFETGGMKGRRKEITRREMHEFLSARIGAQEVYSEYGMTELMSQAYTRGGMAFTPSKAMRVVGRDLTDPFQRGILNETAGINVIDLANVHSISFIETEDLGKIYQDGTFEILGRIDNSDVRGCNLMI
jgi:phenylacetate-coenzyme A ligase PaaK-like adenylate-forming protein